MTNEKVIAALEQVKTYCSPSYLDEMNYAIAVIKKLKKEGIEKPLETDFTVLSGSK